MKIFIEKCLCCIAEFPRDLMHLLRNKLYLINLVPIVCGGYVIQGMFINVVRYIEVHFMERAFVASIITGKNFVQLFHT